MGHPSSFAFLLYFYFTFNLANAQALTSIEYLWLHSLACRHHSEVSSWTQTGRHRWSCSYPGQMPRKKRPWGNDPRRDVGKWKHTGVLLDGLGECSRCGGVFTPALPSVPRHHFNDRPAHRQKDRSAGALMNATSLLSFSKKRTSSSAFFFFFFPDRQFKVFSFGKCLLSRFQEINLSTPFLTILWWNLARLTQAITFAINSDARLRTKIHGCRWP